MTNFEFDDFDTQVNCEEFFSGPTDAELDEMMSEGEWESIPMFPYDVEELTSIVKGLGFDVYNIETIY